MTLELSLVIRVIRLEQVFDEHQHSTGLREKSIKTGINIKEFSVFVFTSVLPKLNEYVIF